MQGNPEADYRIGAYVSDWKKFKAAGVYCRLSTAGHGSNSKSRCLGEFYLGGKENRSRLELLWEESQEQMELPGHCVTA